MLSPPISERCNATAALIIDPTKTAPYKEVLGINNKITETTSIIPINSMYGNKFINVKLSTISGEPKILLIPPNPNTRNTNRFKPKPMFFVVRRELNLPTKFLNVFYHNFYFCLMINIFF